MLVVRARVGIVAAGVVVSFALSAVPAAADVGRAAPAAAPATSNVGVACDAWLDSLTADLVAALAGAGVDVDALRAAVAARDVRATLALLARVDLRVLLADASAAVRAALAALAECRDAVAEDPVVIDPGPGGDTDPTVPVDDPVAPLPDAGGVVDGPVEDPAVEPVPAPGVAPPPAPETTSLSVTAPPAKALADRVDGPRDAAAVPSAVARRQTKPAPLSAPAHDADGGVRESELVSTTASLTTSSSSSSPLARFGETAARLLPLLAAIGFALVVRRQVVAAAIDRRRARA
jgi:hypothetical protein